MQCPVDVAVCGQYQLMYVDCLLKHGVLAAMVTALVHATDVSTIKVRAADITIARQLTQYRDVNILYVQPEYFHVAAQNVPHVPDVLAMSQDLI